jgi:hypothetical protein
MKKALLILAWMVLTTGTLALSPFLIEKLTHQDKVLATTADQQHALSPAETTDFGEVKGIETTVEAEDGREELVAAFLKRYDSPLQPYDHYGKVFVEIADKYGIDFRLLPAIAMQESNLCKSIPPGGYNCLGFGIHERGTLAFESFEANFDRAGRELKKNYIDHGLVTPEQIMHKYTPSSNGSWASSVNQWMAEMRYNDHAMGKEMKTNANVLEFATATGTVATPIPKK